MTKRIAFFSFADIDNYGDILFSHVFDMEIKKRIKDVVIDYYCPTEFSFDGINYQAYNRAKVIEAKYDALILFGGEVIHLFDEKTWKPIYKKNNKKLESPLPSDTAFDWTNISGPYKAWISVGVRPPETDHLEKIQDAINHLDFVSVRGVLSKKILEGMDLMRNNPKIQISPDLGWLFSSILDYKNARGKHFNKFISFDKYALFQINNIQQEEAKLIGGFLQKFSEENKISIVLLPVIRPWEDIKYLNLINETAGTNFLVLPNNLNLVEMADVIVNSRFILCSSLHASITAMSSGIPAAIINKWSGTKLQDLFGHQFRLNLVRHNLNEIPGMLKTLNDEANSDRRLLKSYSDFMQESLNDTFQKLVNNIIVTAT